MKRSIKIAILAALCSLAGCGEQGANQSLAHEKGTAPKPVEITLVSMAGWAQTAGTMGKIERSMVEKISASLPGYRIKVKRRYFSLLPQGDSELFLALEYKRWKQRKNTSAGRNDQFVAVGYSSGATAIYSLLKNGTFQEGPNAPAFLGLVDMALPIGTHDLTGKTPRNGDRTTKIVHYHRYGTARIKGIQNTRVGGSHFSIIKSRTVTQGLAADAARVCRQNSIQNMDADN
jgi:hypothetical protein